MSAAREVVITYGSFASNATGWNLNGVHTLDQDERSFTLTYDVVTTGTDASTVDGYVDSMIAALNERHQTLTVAVDGTNFYYFTDGVDAAVGGAEGAEFIQAEWELLGTHRSKRSRAYRITITVTRAANQTGKTGVYKQEIRVSTLPTNQKTLFYRAQFTPNPAGGETALERYADGTLGFEALVSGIQGTLGGTWERIGSINQAYEEDARTLTASARYITLLYDQSSVSTNDTTLVGVSYDIAVKRDPGLGIPELEAKPFTTVSVRFSAAVDQSVTTDLDFVIKDRVIPYVTAIVANYLTLTSAPVLLGHDLRANPTTSRISGGCVFLADEGTQVLEVSKRTVDSVFRGDNYVPVLDGEKWTRDKHTGPGAWSRRVVIAIRVVGNEADAGLQLQSLEDAEVDSQEQLGFPFVAYGIAASTRGETFRPPFGLSGDVTTSVATSTLEFTRADVRTAASGSGGSRVRRGGASGGSTESTTFRER